MLLFSEYDKSLENIYISQPVVDINLGDTNNYLVRFPKFKRVTHMILAFDAENLFLKSKSSYVLADANDGGARFDYLFCSASTALDGLRTAIGTDDA